MILESIDLSHLYIHVSNSVVLNIMERIWKNSNLTLKREVHLTLQSDFNILLEFGLTPNVRL